MAVADVSLVDHADGIAFCTESGVIDVMIEAFDSIIQYIGVIVVVDLFDSLRPALGL